MEVGRLREDLKLTTGRLNTATGQAADLLQQLKAVQAENASLLGQLALSQGRDTEAAAAHSALQETLEAMKADLTRCGWSSGQQLIVGKCTVGVRFSHKGMQAGPQLLCVDTPLTYVHRSCS